MVKSCILLFHLDSISLIYSVPFAASYNSTCVSVQFSFSRLASMMEVSGNKNYISRFAVQLIETNECFSVILYTMFQCDE